ncbi:hypothetical protein SDC9_141816 [bioreactor metagenome]|uniref:Uncharacterized protein n=1 Tax=bioreactor metagenome TaxID=1076179 RepID=A0A645DZV4_9ZZZZ
MIFHAFRIIQIIPDVEHQRTGSHRRVKYAEQFLILLPDYSDPCHHIRNFMGRVKFSGFLPCFGGKLTDQKFIGIPDNIAVMSKHINAVEFFQYFSDGDVTLLIVCTQFFGFKIHIIE